MKYVPFVAQVENWKRAFSPEAPNASGRSRWLVGQKGEGSHSSPIQVVTPTQQAVERAKSQIKRMKENSAEQSFIKVKKMKSSPKKKEAQLKRFKRK